MPIEQPATDRTQSVRDAEVAENTSGTPSRIVRLPMRARGFAAVKARAANWFEVQAGAARLLPMEGMRGLSALLVFFVHFHALFGSRIEQSPVHLISLSLATLGHCGVDVFFALSGFIIYGMLLRKPHGYFSFVRRRIGRLYPAFTAIFLVYLCLSIALP